MSRAIMYKRARGLLKNMVKTAIFLLTTKSFLYIFDWMIGIVSAVNLVVK